MSEAEEDTDKNIQKHLEVHDATFEEAFQVVIRVCMRHPCTVHALSMWALVDAEAYFPLDVMQEVLPLLEGLNFCEWIVMCDGALASGFTAEVQDAWHVFITQLSGRDLAQLRC